MNGREIVEIEISWFCICNEENVSLLCVAKQIGIYKTWESK